jgi:hypothetical protein
MEVSPLDLADADGRAGDAVHHLNTVVAIAVALLSTFIGVCKVKDDNIVQAMQQAQADRVDHWSYYQAKNVRADLARATADELRAQAAALPPPRAAALATLVTRYDSLAANEARKRDDVRRQAEADQRAYDALNYRDDQFDLADTLAAIAVSLLAMTSLTRKRWLLGVALGFAALAVLMGLAALARWPIHPDAIARLLS